MTIKPEEVARVVVNGVTFELWESVFVRDSWREPYATFRFTVAERDPIPDLWERVQLKPTDHAAVYLGNQLAVTGYILIRQASYDANAHGVMLQGVGRTWCAARGSIVSQNSNFDNMTLKQVADKVNAPFGIRVLAKGVLNSTPFKRLQSEPGEFVWTFLERLARPRGAVLGSTHRGEFLLVGQHSDPVEDRLVEGHNILRCQATFDVSNVWQKYFMRGSTAGTDGHSGRTAGEQEATADGRNAACSYSPLVMTAEQPVWSVAELKDRVNNEAKWNQGTELRVNITVQGWFRPQGGLWRPGQNVMVYSPMAMIPPPAPFRREGVSLGSGEGMILKVETATFTQDSNAGSLTQLELVAPWLLNDRPNFGGLSRIFPQPPEEGQSSTQPPATPQSGTIPDPPPETLEGNA